MSEPTWVQPRAERIRRVAENLLAGEIVGDAVDAVDIARSIVDRVTQELEKDLALDRQIRNRAKAEHEDRSVREVLYGAKPQRDQEKATADSEDVNFMVTHDGHLKGFVRASNIDEAHKIAAERYGMEVTVTPPLAKPEPAVIKGAEAVADAKAVFAEHAAPEMSDPAYLLDVMFRGAEAPPHEMLTKAEWALQALDMRRSARLPKAPQLQPSDTVQALREAINRCRAAGYDVSAEVTAMADDVEPLKHIVIDSDRYLRTVEEVAEAFAKPQPIIAEPQVNGKSVTPSILRKIARGLGLVHTYGDIDRAAEALVDAARAEGAHLVSGR